MAGPGLTVPLNDPRLPALRRVRPPAFLLLCVGSLNILFCLAVAGALAFGWRLPTGADPATLAQEEVVTLPLLLTIAGAVVSGLLSIWAALSAFSLRGWGLVVVGSVTAMFPLTPACCLGVPFAAWMLWVLNSPEVKEHFH
jgi:hypothetical protein